jgi:hypothetical protein
VRQVTIGDIFTDEEIERARTIRDECGAGEFARRFADEVVTPVLPRINAALGQENDARYLAYMVEHALGQSAGPRM